MKYEHCYRNNINSTFFARARLNALRLEEAKGRGNIYYDSICKLCKQEEEDLQHFIVECPKLERTRSYEILDEEILEPRKRLIQCLFKQKKHQETGKMIKNMWYKRKNLIEQGNKGKNKNNGLRAITRPPASDPGPNREEGGRKRLQERHGNNIGILFGEIKDV